MSWWQWVVGVWEFVVAFLITRRYKAIWVALVAFVTAPVPPLAEAEAKVAYAAYNSGHWT